LYNADAVKKYNVFQTSSESQNISQYEEYIAHTGCLKKILNNNFYNGMTQYLKKRIKELKK